MVGCVSIVLWFNSERGSDPLLSLPCPGALSVRSGSATSQVADDLRGVGIGNCRLVAHWLCVVGPILGASAPPASAQRAWLGVDVVLYPDGDRASDRDGMLKGWMRQHRFEWYL